MLQCYLAKRGTFIAGICLIAGTLSIGALAADATVPVTQKGRSFHPDTVQLVKGDTLHILNDDEFTHQAYVDDPAFHYESEEQNPGDTINIVFTARGEFEVRCHIHPKMKMHVSVK